MALVTSTNLLAKAMEQHYAVPAFNANSYEMIPALIHAAEQQNSPIIIQIGKKYLGYTPADEIGALAIYLAKKASAPVCIHLDHGADLAMAKDCLACGYSSIMYDGSSLPDDENIRNTKEIVALAKEFNVPVEGEIGQVLLAENVSNGSEMDFLTDPMQAKRFVEETGVASVAVAVGNIHRMKKKFAKLDFARIEAIRGLVSVPMVIHGSSGISDGDVQKAIAAGISKVNVATEFSIAFTDTLRDFTTAKPEEFFPMDALTEAMKQVTTIARDRIRVVGANNKA